MAQVIMYSGVLYPLTEAVFGPQGSQTLMGELHVGVDPDDEPIGAVFVADGKLYTHPSLFDSLVGRRLFTHVRVTLEDGVLKARRYDPNSQDQDSAWDSVTHEAAPVPASDHVSLEMVLYFMELLNRQQGACWMTGCPQHGMKHQLDRRNSALVQHGLTATPKVICGECCDTRLGKNDHARIHLDGRRIPFNTPVHITAPA